MDLVLIDRKQGGECEPDAYFIASPGGAGGDRFEERLTFDSGGFRFEVQDPGA